jgi:hypothetical protein
MQRIVVCRGALKGRRPFPGHQKINKGWCVFRLPDLREERVVMRVDTLRLTGKACVVLVVLGLPFLAGCAGSVSSDGPSSPNVTGDEKGGKIAGGVSGGTSAPAMGLVTAHCQRFGKKGFITQMDYDAGTLTFQCLQQKAKPTA